MLSTHLPSYRTLGLICLGALLILGIAIYRPAARPEIAPPWAVQVPVSAPERQIEPGQPTPTAAPLAGAFIPRSLLDIFTAEGLYAADEQARLAVELEQALGYVSARFGTAPLSRISAYVGWDANCSLHGIAYTGDRNTQVFTCPDLPRVRAVNIMAHEFVHQLAHDRYGDAHLGADMILLEGTATWGAGDYWLGDAPNFRSFVRPWVQGGQALPLATSYIGRPIGDMNTLYYQWGSFVEFLIETYGRERFDQVYASGNGSVEPGSADYSGVYGKGLSQLEQEWRAWAAR